MKKLSIYAPILACALLPLLAGCPNPNTYGTPRTIPKGEIQHTVAVEAISVSSKNDSIAVPMLPTYQFRYGVADSVDFGVRITNASMLGADVKINFVRSDSFDLAINPGAQITSVPLLSTDGGSSSATIAYLHLPVLLGLNLNEDVTLFASPGFTYLAAAASNSSSGARVSGGGAAVRLGLGAQFRAGKAFAVTPEVTGMRFVNDGNILAITFGVGFNFGALPKYGSTTAPAPAAAQPLEQTAPPAAAPPAAAPQPASAPVQQM